MSSSSSSSASQTTLNGQVTEKLTRTNYVMWRTQVTPHLCGAGVFGYVDGTTPEPARLHVTKDKDGKESAEPNPLHPIWVREDQQVLGYLLSTLSKEGDHGHHGAGALDSGGRYVFLAVHEPRE